MKHNEKSQYWRQRKSKRQHSTNKHRFAQSGNTSVILQIQLWWVILAPVNLFSGNTYFLIILFRLFHNEKSFRINLCYHMLIFCNHLNFAANIWTFVTIPKKMSCILQNLCFYLVLLQKWCKNTISSKQPWERFPFGHSASYIDREGPFSGLCPFSTPIDCSLLQKLFCHKNKNKQNFVHNNLEYQIIFLIFLPKAILAWKNEKPEGWRMWWDWQWKARLPLSSSPYTSELHQKLFILLCPFFILSEKSSWIHFSPS